MKRYVIKQHDKSTSGAYVTQGEPSSTHHGTPLAFVGAPIYCPTCKSEGRIVPTGPRWPMSFMGEEVALDNDLGMCDCEPTPRMIASQSTMSQSFTDEALAVQGYTPLGVPFLRHYDEGIRLRDARTMQPLAHVPYRVKSGAKILTSGVTDTNGRIDRIETNAAEDIVIEIHQGTRMTGTRR